MHVEQLIEGLDLRLTSGPAATVVAQVTDDSRRVRPGAMFVARAGSESDGMKYVADAIAGGAAAAVSEQPALAELPGGVAWVQAGAAIRQDLVGELAERFHDRPSGKLKLVGVTGTNGKTTTGFIAQHLLAATGVKTGLIGTVIVDDGDERRSAELTTPGAAEFSEMLAAMVANGCAAAVAEVSSHALHQGRTAALYFDCGVFTNLTGDHLDYHGDMESYAAAKARLFEQLDDAAFAVVNADDEHGERMVAGARAQRRWCTVAGADCTGDVCRAEVMELTAALSRARFVGPWGDFEVTLPLVGRHNVYNALQAAAAAVSVADIAADDLRAALECCPAVPGRLEPVTASWPQVAPADDAEPQPAVLVDYAHTHDALENVLEALRPVTTGELIVLFGCGGDRDRGKRPKMAEVACRLGDRVVITSDNPRTEDPEGILNDIQTGVPEAAAEKTQVQIDRAAAIALAIDMAGPGDTVVIAGKGHEDYQILGTKKIHFDDREQAAEVLQQRGAQASL